MQRRTLLHTTALALPVAFLAACATGTTPPTTVNTVNSVANDIVLISQGVSAMLVSLEATPNLDPAKLKQLEDYVSQLRAAANAIAAVNIQPPASAVQQVAKIVQALAPIALALIPGGSGLTAIVQAALSLLPVVLSAVGVAAAPGVAPKYSPDAARVILAGARR